ncbi:acyl-CoA dehydrogenase family protein [Nocardia testacea]|uniref:acyl-CoA dehydrogenase family protein n=1 Tax=Nocardia testacea TaxID=248551 RepID=UPI000311B50F|nr:acyl-CoA dehydrogenase family protein [Nocardia testacea]
MTPSDTWRGPALDRDQRDLRDMLDAFAAAHNPVLADEPEQVAGLVTELAALGVWTLGTAEETGGGGADRATTALVFERLGRAWPALGWAAAQAHTAIDVLGADQRFADLVTGLHAGTAAVAVVDATAAQVRLTRQGGTLSGTVARVDAAAERPHLLLLGDAGHAVLLPPVALTPEPLRRTGFGGALTRSLEVDARPGEYHDLDSVDTAAARRRLRLGAAAVAAGIAGAAADAAAEYASGREQFGAPLTALPTVRQALLGQAARAAVSTAAAFGAEDEVAVLAALREACEGAIEAAAGALQAHGGYGYLTEYGAERRLRDAISLRAATDPGGAATAVARALAGLPPIATAIRKDAS